MLDLILVVIAIATGGPDGPAERVETASAPKVEAADARAPSAEAPPPSSEADPAPVPVLPYPAEQQVATGRFTTAVEVKPILSATRANWIAVREFDGQDLVYVTHLWAWRCGLVAIHVGINGAEPEPWPLPDCHEDTNAPNAMLPDDGLPYRAFPLKSVESMTVEVIYDDLTTEKVSFDRRGAMIP
ncbi:MAG: hypothetical protein CMF72_05950 [Mameliella sp.]|nr:hypothetical protein [Mameliella sp.]|tara:strand:- start:11134 stop:11691 length:558 start_codon:yes stop_codon:yes gene_type:complete